MCNERIHLRFAHFWNTYTYWRGQTLYSFTNKVSQDLKTGRAEMEVHVSCCVIITINKDSPYRASKGTTNKTMKKVFLVTLSFFALTCTVNAQSEEDMQKCKERAEKLQQLCNDYKTSGVANIDGYGNAVKEAAIFAVGNSETLRNMYQRQIGKTKDGVTDVTIKKPTLEEWVTLSVGIAGEAAKIKEATDKVQQVAAEVKSLGEAATAEKNPLKVAKAAKKAKIASAVLEFGNAATPILLEESAAQVKAVNGIIQILKSGKNL